jgi:hypothetical protein
MSTNKKGFNLRSFTSFSLVISTIIMAWSGFILYVAPPGRIANWGTWKLMLFTKSEWQALHTIFSYMFFILFIIHLFFVNWRAFLTYFRSKVQAGLNRKWELAAAIILSTIFFLGTLKSWVPFGSVMAFGEKVKESWEGSFQSPPVLHMEIYTIDQLSALFDSIPPAELLKTLNDSGLVTTSTEMTMKEIAEENHTTPSAIYNILASKYKKEAKSPTGEVPQGIGRYTVKMTADRSGKNVSDLVNILKDYGIAADGETSLRSIAEQLGMSPRELYSLLVE